MVDLTKLAALRRAVLHEWGVVFELRSLGHISITSNKQCPENFCREINRREINRRVVWISLDLDAISFADGRYPSLKHKIWIFHLF